MAMVVTDVLNVLGECNRQKVRITEKSLGHSMEPHNQPWLLIWTMQCSAATTGSSTTAIGAAADQSSLKNVHSNVHYRNALYRLSVGGGNCCGRLSCGHGINR